MSQQPGKKRSHPGGTSRRGSVSKDNGDRSPERKKKKPDADIASMTPGDHPLGSTHDGSTVNPEVEQKSPVAPAAPMYGPYQQATNASHLAAVPAPMSPFLMAHKACLKQMPALASAAIPRPRDQNPMHGAPQNRGPCGVPGDNSGGNSHHGQSGGSRGAPVPTGRNPTAQGQSASNNAPQRSANPSAPFGPTVDPAEPFTQEDTNVFHQVFLAMYQQQSAVVEGLNAIIKDVYKVYNMHLDFCNIPIGTGVKEYVMNWIANDGKLPGYEWVVNRPSSLKFISTEDLSSQLAKARQDGMQLGKEYVRHVQAQEVVQIINDLRDRRSTAEQPANPPSVRPVTQDAAPSNADVRQQLARAKGLLQAIVAQQQKQWDGDVGPLIKEAAKWLEGGMQRDADREVKTEPAANREEDGQEAVTQVADRKAGG